MWVANGKLSVGDVEAKAAGTFDVDQSALANDVLHQVNNTRFCTTNVVHFLALFSYFWWLIMNWKPSKLRFLILLLGICAWHKSFTLQTYKYSVVLTRCENFFKCMKSWNIYIYKHSLLSNLSRYVYLC